MVSLENYETKHTHAWMIHTRDRKTPLIVVTEFLDTRSSEEAAPATPKKPKVAEVSDMSEEDQIRAAIEASLHGKARDSPKHGEEHEEQAEEEEPQEEDEPQDDTLSTLQPVKRDEPTDLANSTRVQLRMADGTRIIRRFLKTDPVRYLFEFVKAEVPETQDRSFEVCTHVAFFFTLLFLCYSISSTHPAFSRALAGLQPKAADRVFGPVHPGRWTGERRRKLCVSIIIPKKEEYKACISPLLPFFFVLIAHDISRTCLT